MAIPAIVNVPIASGAAAGRTPAKSPTCRSLPSIGGPALPICARGPSAGGVVVHGEHRAEVANHRRDHVAVQLPYVLGYSVTALQPDPGGVDRLLPERAEALALERRVAPAHFPAREEMLEAVVGGARQQHAAQDLAPLVAVSEAAIAARRRNPSHASTSVSKAAPTARRRLAGSRLGE